MSAHPPDARTHVAPPSTWPAADHAAADARPVDSPEGACLPGSRPTAPADDGEGLPLSALEYVVVDVETTGGSTRTGHRVTEIAALRVAHDGSILEEFTTLVNPERPIPPFISALTNITWDMVRDAPRFHEIAAEVGRLLEGRIFVAHNAPFDWRFLSWELEHATGVAPQARVLCTVRLARKVVPEVASRSLDSLAYFFGLDNDARHRAFGDARVTAALLGRLMRRLDDRGIASWEALQALLAQRTPRRSSRRRATPTSMDPSEIPAQ